MTSIPSVSVTYARSGSSTKANEFGMRPMQALAYDRRGEQYLLIKSPPASAIERIRDGSITDYVYDATTARLEAAASPP